jgi:IMP dehydrogenase
MTEIRTGLTYDDVLLVPRRSRVRSRQDVTTRSRFTPRIELEVPIASANMDTVTTAPMAIAMAQLGGIGVLHRFLPVEEEAADVRRVKRFLSHVVVEPYVIDPDRTITHARAEAERLQVTGFVVVGPDQQLLGLLTARDLLAGEGPERVDALMTPRERLVTAQPGIGLDEARRLLTTNRVEKLPLVDEQDRVQGLVTLRDLALADRYPRATRDDKGRLRVAAAIGIRGDYLLRSEALIAAEADALVLDIAHGHADAALEAVHELKAAWPETEVVAGNVATPDAVADLAEAGADANKVGIGPGFACTTRLVAGVGVPQLTAVLDCAPAARDRGVPLIADGGIRRAGHVAMAIAAGSSTVMVGSLFAGRDESPGDVVRRRGRAARDRGPWRRARPVRRRGRGDGVPAARLRRRHRRGAARRPAQRHELRRRDDDPRVLGAGELHPPDRGRRA